LLNSLIFNLFLFFSINNRLDAVGFVSLFLVGNSIILAQLFFLVTSVFRDISDFLLVSRSGSDDSGVDGAGDAVLVLDVDLGHGVGFFLVSVDGSLLNISLTGGVDHVLDHEPLDGLVLSDESAAVSAVDGIGVSFVVLVSSIISSLLGHSPRYN
jgi:hypothetical protein